LIAPPGRVAEARPHSHAKEAKVAFRFLHLDASTRSFMLTEVERDTSEGTLYLSPRLTDRGRRDWPDLLRRAAESGTEISLAESLRGTGRLKEVESRRTSPRRGWGWGRVVEVRVPSTAAMTLAEGEFNRFYIRGLCLRAMEAGIAEVTVYRAKHVENPRPESMYVIGRQLPVGALLDDLRRHSGEEEPSLRVPGGPNSGLSVKLPG
jgi:hypothetical protein